MDKAKFYTAEIVLALEFMHGEVWFCCSYLWNLFPRLSPFDLSQGIVAIDLFTKANLLSLLARALFTEISNQTMWCSPERAMSNSLISEFAKMWAFGLFPKFVTTKSMTGNARFIPGNASTKQDVNMGGHAELPRPRVTSVSSIHCGCGLVASR